MSSDETLLLESRVFRVVRRLLITPDGKEHIRDIVRHPGAVVIVPLLDDGRICLIENVRIAVDQTLVELPAGTRELGEDPEQTARRELAEETGYRAASLRRLTTFFSSPGICDEQMHLFLATRLTPGEPALDGGEQIRPRPTTWPDALAMIRDGRIQDAKTLVGLLWWGVVEGLGIGD
ncbi:MAG: NUDIX hydrolase [Pirellulales bacterium]|nr:NUDIX hydrolase [Pirellulales bacterium]